MAEIIDFFWTNEEDKIIYITNLISNSEHKVLKFLHDRFSEFGLIYELVIFQSPYRTIIESTNLSIFEASCGNELFYALVKFYSKQSAKLSLVNQIEFNGHKLKIKYTNKKRDVLAKILYFKKCFELARYYFGFNGFSLKVLQLSELKKTSDKNISEVTFECTVILNIHQGTLESKGIGRASESLSAYIPALKVQLYHRVRKAAFRAAVEHAFSQVLIIVLDSGKVHVELVGDQELYDRNGLLTVNEMIEYPSSDIEEFLPDEK